MRILRYRAIGLNHNREIDLRFEGNLTFITGVNGTGKTSVLTSLVALLVPDLQTIASVPFESIRVDFELDRKKGFVSATKSNESLIELKCHGTEKPFYFHKFEEDPFLPDGREARSSYYQNLRLQLASQPIATILNSIPSPMFLGLDRQHKADLNTENRYLARNYARRRKRNVFGSVLGASLLQAIGLAEDRYSLVQSRTGVFRSEFLRDLLLSLISLPTSSGLGALDAPTAHERTLPTRALKALRRFPKVEGISAEGVRSRVEPIIQNINEVLAIIPHEFKLESFSVKDKKDRKIFDALIKWNGYKATLEQVTKVSTLIESYNEKVTQASAEIAKYVKLIDDFLGQTSKSVGFDEHGALIIRAPTGQFGAESLSSGEAQVLVLLTHLAFNTAVEEAGVFLIDEPELSLHILWQEMLVDSMIKANSSLQYIIATHSPSILVDRADCAVDIG